MQPSVTPITASSTVEPAAKALMPFSPSITYTSGIGTLEAMAISSTTFISFCSSGSVVAMFTNRPPIIEAMLEPPPLSWLFRNRPARQMITNVPSTTHRASIGSCRVEKSSSPLFRPANGMTAAMIRKFSSEMSRTATQKRKTRTPVFFLA